MSSHPILPEARRAAIEAVFDEALAEVRAAGDVALLQECRALFRKRVPLAMRAYVAAALALGSAGSGGASGKPGRKQDASRTDRGDKRNNSGQKDARPAPASNAASVSSAVKAPMAANAPTAAKAGKAGTPAKGRVPPAPENRENAGRQTRNNEREPREREPREVELREREPRVREPRENRYHGEGVTLFVSAGRRQRFYARVAIKILLETPGIAEGNIGDIRTMDNYSFIVVDPAIEDAVLATLNGFDFKGRVLAANRARKRDENDNIDSGDADLGDADSGDADLGDDAELTEDDVTENA